MELERMSLAELKQLQKDVARAIETYRERQKQEARAVLEAKAQELGFNLAELAPAARKKASRSASAAPAKYRHPENPTMTWSGRGRRPNWVTAALEEGRTLEEMAI